MKVLNQEAIRRMINGGASSVVAVSGGGGGGGGLSPAWVEENYVSKSFFSQLFTIHGTKTVTDEETDTTTVEEVEITPNQLIDDEYDVTDVEVRFGLWTQQFLSALGLNGSGGGGGGASTLAGLDDVQLGTLANGQALVYNSSTGKWVNGTVIPDLTNYATKAWVQQQGYITASALTGYATESWVTGKGYITASALTGYATESWVTGKGYATESWVTGKGYATESWVTGKGYATETWVEGKGYALAANVYSKTDADAKFLTVAFFNRLFQAYNGTTLVNANDTTSTIDNIKAIFGFWTEKYISALGKNNSGGGGGGSSTLAGLDDVELSTPQNGQALVYNNGNWVNGTVIPDLTDYATKVWVQQQGYITASALTGYATESWVTGKGYATETWVTGRGYITASALTGYATETWVQQQGYLTAETYLGTVTRVNTGTGLTGGPINSSGTISISTTYQTYIAHGQTAYGWGNHANAGYLTGDDIQDMATKTWVTNTANAASATKLQTARMLWGNNFNGTQSIGTPESWAPLNWVTNIVMNGNLDWRYGGADSMTSRILEYESGRLSVNDCAFHFRSLKSANSSTFPGGALDVTTDWGGYSFRNVLTGHSLFENTLFLRQDLYMKTNTGIRIKNYAGADVMALSLESSNYGNNIIVGAGAHTVAGVSTFIRGYSVNFQTANGAGSTQVGHFDNSGNFYIDVAGKSLLMNDGTTTRSMLGINIPATHFHVCYGAVGADWQTRIYGGGGDDKGIRFYQGTALVASVEGGDHSFVAYNHIKLTTNDKSLYTRNTNSTPIDTVRMGSNNILNFGYGCSTNNHGTRIYGGATAGIGFFCGSTEVASVYRNVDSNQNTYQGIRIGNALLSWDSTNNALKVQRYDGAAVNFYSLGGVSALGFTAPQSSLESFRIDYLTSTNISTQTVDVATQMNLGSANCNIKVNSSSLTINAPAGLTLVTNSGYGLRASRFYLDSSRYIYLDGTTLKYYNGSQSKTIVLS